MELSEEQINQYSIYIDEILSKSDLATISVRKVRNKVQETVGQDLSHQKLALNVLIEERFDKITSEPLSSPEVSKSKAPKTTTNGITKTKVKDEDTRDNSDGDEPPPKKKQKRQLANSDAKLAALLQAQENSRARATRGGVSKKPVKAKATKRKKSAAKIKAADDSDIELNSDGEKKVVERKGGFHKQYALSEPLAALVGEPQLSRPQVVKKIWAHIKANDLQDPSDKRQIFCDNKMKLVFKQDTVHMFTMNKLLGKHLYEVEELEAEAS